MSERESFQQYLAEMAALGFRPSTALGQNFLLDPTLHRWLADQAEATAADTVVEIGVGLGFLTRELVVRAGTVLGVEIDGRLLQIAQRALAEATNLTWLHSDALAGPGRTLVPEIAAAGAAAHARGGRFLVVANLPYAVAGPLLAELAAQEPCPDRAILLVQKEMAERAAARQDSGDYGGLSAFVQAVYRAALLRDVGPQVFRPRPKVVSAVLRLDRRQDLAPALVPGKARREFGVFVRQLFQQRRKVMRTTWPQAAAAIGRTAPPLPEGMAGRRAEELAPDDLVRLWSGLVG